MDWTKVITNRFFQKSIYLVRDDDCILEANEIKDSLVENGITVINYSDPVHFRFTYEREFRNKYKGTLIIRLLHMEFEVVPWDVYECAFQNQISITDIFPLLETKAIIEVPTKLWQKIYQGQEKTNEQLNYLETQGFIKKILGKESIGRKYVLNEAPDFNEALSYFYKADKQFEDWGEISETIGKHRLYYENDRDFEKLINETNSDFQAFIADNFDKNLSLVTLKKPNYVNQILSFMVRNLDKTNKRHALIVMDGMSFTQWAMIEKYLSQNKIITKTDSIIAWVPSITSVSRQAIFSGKRPSEFFQSITVTSREESHWREFWTKKGFMLSEIKYQKNLGHKLYQEEELYFRYNSTKIYGCVINVIDEFMHGAKQGQVTIQSELEIWLNRGYLLSMLQELLMLDYEIFLTSDHGNIEASGIGQIRQGVLATSRGQRVRTYDDVVLRRSTFNSHPDKMLKWNSSTLPINYLPLIAKERVAFAPKDSMILTHGGTHIEELLVPFVKIIKKGDLSK
ncbi:MAG: BREX-3 system phosphatase PglZ [Carnobacterium sp.]|nr:BREX-3 system phosphatase PglZ [Carnobacterium sp.]